MAKILRKGWPLEITLLKSFVAQQRAVVLSYDQLGAMNCIYLKRTRAYIFAYPPTTGSEYIIIIIDFKIIYHLTVLRVNIEYWVILFNQYV